MTSSISSTFQSMDFITVVCERFDKFLKIKGFVIRATFPPGHPRKFITIKLNHNLVLYREHLQAKLHSILS